MSVSEDILTKLYYTDKNYGGLNQLYDKAKLVDKKITKAKVKTFLEQQKAYQQTKKVVGKKLFLPIYTDTPYSFQIDLTFFPRY